MYYFASHRVRRMYDMEEDEMDRTVVVQAGDLYSPIYIYPLCMALWKEPRKQELRRALLSSDNHDER